MNFQSIFGDGLATLDEDSRELEVFSDDSFENTLEITSKQHFVSNLSNNDVIQDIFNKRSKNNRTTPLLKEFNKKIKKVMKSKSSIIEVFIAKSDFNLEDKCANSIIHDDKDIILDDFALWTELTPASNAEFNQASVSDSQKLVENNSNQLKKRKSSKKSDNSPLNNSKNYCRSIKSKKLNVKTENKLTTKMRGINNKAKNFQKIFGQAVVRFILYNEFSKKSQMCQIYQASGLKDEKTIMIFKDWVISISRSYIRLEMFRKVWLGNFQNFVDRKFAEILTKFTKIFLFEECLDYFKGGKFKDQKVVEKYLECIEIFKSGFERPENFTSLLRYF